MRKLNTSIRNIILQTATINYMPRYLNNLSWVPEASFTLKIMSKDASRENKKREL